MTDDWSLKDKVVVRNDDKGHWSMFHYRDIETLRQKLIQDYNQYIRNKYYYPDKMEEIDFIDIINKRFGVEE